MKTKTILVAPVATLAVGSVAQSCMAVATSSIGLSIIKNILLGGITKGLGLFKDKDAFLQNNLIDQALPQPLQQVNSILSKVAPNLVTKQREYIAQAAAYTVNISEPILVNAVNSLTADDVNRIVNGGNGMATAILKEKTSQQLINAILPKVDEKLNQFGIVKSVNTALQGSSILSSILGSDTTSTLSASGGVSKLASEQLVNGLFNIIKDYENTHSADIRKAIGK